MLLIYNHLKLDFYHFLKLDVYLYQVILSNSTLVYIPNLQSLEIGRKSFSNTINISLSSNSVVFDIY